MVFTPLHPPVPTQYEAPAYPPRALSRLALSQAYAEVADLATCLEMADALALTEDQARERYTEMVDRWYDTLAQPWQHSGEVVVSRLPAGAREPARTAHHLDRWCAEHLPPTSAARQTARREGVSDRMVSGHLPTQPVTPTPAGLPPTTTAQPGHAAVTAVVEGGRQ